jgi:uncharacterized protein YdhG (YjbR/CyaY superfamily)
MRSTPKSKVASSCSDSVADYIAAAPDNVRQKLNDLRRVIRQAAPEAIEKIGYGMPTFHLHGNLVHFAACQAHLGFYPTPSAIVRFEKELRKFVTSKGAIQLPLDQPLPLRLIERIVKFRVAENVQKQQAKMAQRKKG